MSRLPVRVRLTLAFALAMAIVLAAVGALLYVRLAASLEEQLDENLEVRAAGLAPLVREGRIPEPADDDEVVEVLAGLGDQRQFVRRDVEGEPFRLLITPVGERTLVVGASLEDRDEALAGLLAQLLVVGPLALLLSALAGYALAGAAFRPVEAMRRRAADVSSERSGQRLPVPRARDEIRRLGETLNAMLERLEAGLARERRFVADAGHELRTPLALLKTELELALRRPRSQADLERTLRSAADEVDRLARLAEDLLALARVDEGRLPLRQGPIVAGELLATVARRFAARADAEGRALDLDGGTNVPLVGDALRLEQALGNLVDNALRHGAGAVRLEAESRDGVVELRVGDEGAGFPPDFLPHAFDRFTRADEARGGGASGLGLAIVDAVARAHGGRALAANGAGGGAVVTIALPRAENV